MIELTRSSELIAFKDHVMILYKDRWRLQNTVKNCNRVASWEQLTKPPYHKIHCLKRCSKVGLKGTQEHYQFSPETQEWIGISLDS